MTLTALCSVRGAPGVTTAAVTLAGVWPDGRDVLVWEADPAGGVLAARFGLGDTPGSIDAAASRGGWDDTSIWHHTQSIDGGAPVLVGTESAVQASAMLSRSDDLVAWMSATQSVDVLADCGRAGARSPADSVMSAADAVILVARPKVEQLRPGAHFLRQCVRLMDDKLIGWLLVGEKPYDRAVVEETWGLPVVGVLADDPRTAAVLAGERVGSNRQLRRSLLVRSARSVAEDLWYRLHPHRVGEVASS